MAYKEVEWLFQRDVEETYNITVGGEVITTTDEHPFWIVGKGWVEAQNLVVDDVLTTSDGKELAIEKIVVKKEHATVYNFMVKDFHTYFVSNLGIWTHNACKVGDTTSGGRGFTEHGAQRANERGYTPQKLDNIVDNYSQKVYQPGGLTVYAKKEKDGYHVAIVNSNNEIVSVVGGQGGKNTLPNWNAVTRMLENNGGYSSLPYQ